MTNKEIAERMNELSRTNHWKDSNIGDALIDIDVNGETYHVYLAGNDEMFDLNEFYQIGLDGKGSEWEFYYATTDENGDDIGLGDIDYSKSYRVEKVEDKE